MGYNRCGVESRKVLWLIGLMFGLVMAIQYFELPYRDSMSYLISTGKGFFSFSDSNRDVVGFKEKYPESNSPPPIAELVEGSTSAPEHIMARNSKEINHNAEVERTIAISPVPAANDISPSAVPYRAEIITVIAASPTGSSFPVNVDISPSVSSFREETSALVPASELNATLLAPSVSPAYNDSRNSEIAKSNHSSSDEVSSMTNSPPPPKKVTKRPAESVLSVSEMNDMLLQSRASSFSKSPLWSSPADKELVDARFQIEHATIIMDHPTLSAPIFRNLSTFTISYEKMEQKLKVYIYKDGKRPVFHQPRLKGIYASEGWFMKLMEASNQFVTKNPREAHLFYLPFSSQLLVDYVYVRDSHTFKDINDYLNIYIDSIKSTHPYWNRTDGADHFLVACHDWAPIETRRLMANCIRALCNSDVKEGFKFGKDVSLPETRMEWPQKPMKEIGGNPPSKRKILAFFAGQMHGYLRPILLKHWENKDAEMKIVGRMRKGYDWHMKNSKYCICAKGYEVNSPRVVEAIIYGCVPVIISDNFVPPFFEMLNWDSFAVFVPEKDIPNLKNILLSISEAKYVVMQHRVNQVRQHFVWHDPPEKYDIFHMILHSIWYNRVFRLPPR